MHLPGPPPYFNIRVNELRIDLLILQKCHIPRCFEKSYPSSSLPKCLIPQCFEKSCPFSLLEKCYKPRCFRESCPFSTLQKRHIPQCFKESCLSSTMQSALYSGALRGVVHYHPSNSAPSPGALKRAAYSYYHQSATYLRTFQGSSNHYLLFTPSTLALDPHKPPYPNPKQESPTGSPPLLPRISHHLSQPNFTNSKPRISGRTFHPIHL